MDRRIRKPNLGVAKEKAMNCVDGCSFFSTSYAGRQVDYTGAGLRLLIAQYAYGPLCLYHCLTGRPFQYRATSNPDEWLTPYQSFEDGIKHALGVLGITNSTRTHIFDNSKLTPKIYSQKIEDLLSEGPVLIGPFSANLFENEFAHTYRAEPNHCLVCVTSYKDEFLLLHPDGLPYTKSIEQLVEFHRITPVKTTLLLSLRKAIITLSIPHLMELALIAGAKLVQCVMEAHGPAAFLNCIMGVVSPKMKVKYELSLRFGLSEMSINLQMVLELVRHLVQCQSATMITSSAVCDLCQSLIDVLKSCATLYATPIEEWCEDGGGLNRLLERWERYEDALCAVIPPSDKLDG